MHFFSWIHYWLFLLACAPALKKKDKLTHSSLNSTNWVNQPKHCTARHLKNLICKCNVKREPCLNGDVQFIFREVINVCRQHKALRALSRPGHRNGIRLAWHKDFYLVLFWLCLSLTSFDGSKRFGVWGAWKSRDKSSDWVVRCVNGSGEQHTEGGWYTTILSTQAW